MATSLSFSQQQISLVGAKQVIANARAEAEKLGLSISIAVVDRGGELVAFERGDNASLVTINVAVQKAKTAAYLKAPSKLFETFINNGLPSFLFTPDVTPLQGGVPIVLDGEVIGAIGVSGGKGDQDNSIAEAAAVI